MPLEGQAVKPLSELGSAQRRHNGFRACIRVARGELHVGPLRDTEAEALSDLAEMRGAASRADVGLVVARLRAEAVKPLCERGGLEWRPNGCRARM